MVDYERVYKGDAIFLTVARMCCSLGQRFPRKELHESFEAARIIQNAFPDSQIVLDGAAGHGLVGLLLLVLDPRSQRVCLAVDRQRPQTAILLAEAFEKEWPGLGKRYRYVEGDLKNINPNSQSLMISIHACGSLSDLVLSAGIEASCDLAVIPCCQAGSQYQSKKVNGVDEPLLLFKHYKVKGSQADAQLHTSRMAARYGVTLAVDAARVKSLRTSGYHVKIEKLPEGITGRARVILAKSPGLKTAVKPAEALSSMWPEQKLPDSPWTLFKSNG